MKSGVLKVTAILVGIFAAGAAAGGFSTAAWTSPKSPAPEDFSKRLVDRLTAEVKLTPQQIDRIRPVVESFGAPLNDARHKAFCAVDQIFCEMDSKVVVELTPEQRVLYTQMRDRDRKCMEKRCGSPLKIPANSNANSDAVKAVAVPNP